MSRRGHERSASNAKHYARAILTDTWSVGFVTDAHPSGVAWNPEEDRELFEAGSGCVMGRLAEDYRKRKLWIYMCMPMFSGFLLLKTKYTAATIATATMIMMAIMAYVSICESPLLVEAPKA